jgi:hypothetical protein
MGVRTDAGGAAGVDLSAIAEDLIPSVHNTYNIGTSAKQWAAIWVALALVTSLTIGGVINLSNQSGVLFVNASTRINGSLFVDGNVSAVNISVSGFYFGDGSKLTGISGDNASWNQSGANKLYAPNTTAGIQHLLNATGVYSTYNLTYDGYALNVSINYTLQTYNTYDGRWTATFNASYASFNTTANIQALGATIGNYFNQNLNTTNGPTFKNLTLTGNLSVADRSFFTNNITVSKCIIFNSGGAICSG